MREIEIERYFSKFSCIPNTTRDTNSSMTCNFILFYNAHSVHTTDQNYGTFDAKCFT